MPARLPLIFTLLASTEIAGLALSDEIRLNQIQVIGSHNSYHIAPHPTVLNLIGTPKRSTAEGLDYTHRPFAEQFSDLGIRQIELDVFADPKGGHLSEPAARKILKTLGKDPGPDPDADGVLRRPGLKVMHVQDIDYRTTASTFVDALTQVRTWSRAHPRHVPIMILVELKDEAIAALPTRPLPIGKAEVEAVDAEILSVFERSEILTPDDVRGNASTLPEAIRGRGWPTLDSVRGKVMFALDNEGAPRDHYLEGHPALQGRLLFVSVAPSHPAAAWTKMNDSIKDFDKIQALVHDGFLVRTRADIDTVEARKNDPTRRDKAFASGAQFVSTDYPAPRLESSPYQVRFVDGIAARPNPVSGPTNPSVTDLEGSVGPATSPPARGR
ncbi:phosphatidylinositol-specific phospholipase C1-like protein [Singulisphaera rosea]